jgi:hypothetical protein
MSPTTKTKPTPQPPVPAKPAPPKPPQPRSMCQVVENSDGSLEIMYKVEEHIARRLRSRAHTMPLTRYVEENILKRAFYDATY